jgi:soluble lytic murein transglycosylase-like protein
MMHNKLPTSLIIILLALCASGLVRADIFAYTDEYGVRHFTNVPENDRRYKLIIKSRETEPGYSFPTSAARSTRGGYTPRLIDKSAYDAVVRQAAQLYDVDEALIRAVIHTESAFRPDAVSSKGASGLMQLMPDTATRYGVRDVFDPTENIYGGVRYLRDLKVMFNNNLRLTVAAYNAGENAVQKYGGIPPYPETIDYVSKVLSLHSRYQLNKSM